MVSPVSAETHKEYHTYIIHHAVELHSFIGILQQVVSKGSKSPYTAATFIKHSKINRKTLKSLIDTALTNEQSTIRVPATMIFWVYRGCTATGERCPVELPHICKIKTPTGEKFFATSKQDWVAHRASCNVLDKCTKISDHAKLNYLSRVKGVDIDNLLEDFPYALLSDNKGTLLSDGRYGYTLGDYVYIMANGTCVTVLNKGMVTT